MIRVLSVVLFALLATHARAEQWQYEDGGVPIAWFDTGAAQFQFACRGGDLAMGFWVRAPHRQVAGAASMNLAITPDPARDSDPASTRGSSFAQELPLIHADGTSMIVRGPVARQWAAIAQRAKAAIRVAYVRTNRQGGHEVFDSHVFCAKGSNAAIARVLDRCG